MVNGGTGTTLERRGGAHPAANASFRPFSPARTAIRYRRITVLSGTGRRTVPRSTSRRWCTIEPSLNPSIHHSARPASGASRSIQVKPSHSRTGPMSAVNLMLDRRPTGARTVTQP